MRRHKTGCKPCNEQTGSSSRTGDCRNPCTRSSGLLLFSGITAPSDSGPAISYLADQGTSGTSPAPLPNRMNYPIAQSRKVVDFAVNLIATLSGPGSTLDVQLVRRAGGTGPEIDVPGFVVSYTSTGIATGIQTVVPSPQTFDPGDTFDVRLTSTDSLSLPISATVGLG